MIQRRSAFHTPVEMCLRTRAWARMKKSERIARWGLICKKEVHQDIDANFSGYPNHWRWLLSRSDPDIDHRRVPNPMVFLDREGEKPSITTQGREINERP